VPAVADHADHAQLQTGGRACWSRPLSGLARAPGGPGHPGPLAACRLLWALLGVTVGAYAGAAVLAGLLFYFFNPAGAGDCSFNISVISLTLLLGLLVSAVSMSPYVRAPRRGRTCGAPRV
jgi:hypothetical protein